MAVVMGRRSWGVTGWVDEDDGGSFGCRVVPSPRRDAPISRCLGDSDLQGRRLGTSSEGRVVFGVPQLVEIGFFSSGPGRIPQFSLLTVRIYFPCTLPYLLSPLSRPFPVLSSKELKIYVRGFNLIGRV